MNRIRIALLLPALAITLYVAGTGMLCEKSDFTSDAELNGISAETDIRNEKDNPTPDTKPNGASAKTDIQYEKSDSAYVMGLLAEAQRQPKGTNYMIFFARQMRGLPYVAHTLEVNDTEKLIINLRQLDCTTYVENVLALTLCMKEGAPSFARFCNNIARIRYAVGKRPHYTDRLHYFTSWIEHNTMKGICREIQSPAPPFTGTQRLSIDYMTSHTDSYRMLKINPSYIPEIRKTERELTGRQYKYIPKAEIKNTALLRRTVHDGDIIATTTSIKGLDTQHIGIAVWHGDGLHMLNASSIHRKVVEEPMTLRQYLYNHKSMPGIRVLRVM